jgi:hypothetical protein
MSLQLPDLLTSPTANLRRNYNMLLQEGKLIVLTYWDPYYAI